MSLRIALLGLLSVSGPASGYDLTKKFETSINYVWQAGHSQIYPELAKMAADGLITVEPEGPRGRKIYTITREGTDELHRWLVERVPTDPVRSEGALQAFLLPLLSAPEALDVLSRLTAAAETRLADLRALRATKLALHESDQWKIGYYALDLGIRHALTTIDWARHTAAEIDPGSA
ncbi:PadR family transcriptional regulator [Sphaerisporangium corydalis]|uniref:PadR family transcriptional regulator n=1 Tax=Sphaerisporangium corydalis TaxID=1441875 RepID=A0ABV9EBQ1_9ACTN|nr:PadR family transcriptional regulator [Sphaerisporangium corydalis]